MSDIHDVIFPLGSPGAMLMGEFIRFLARSHPKLWDCRMLMIRTQVSVSTWISARAMTLRIGITRLGEDFEADIVWNLDDEPALQTADDGGADMYTAQSIAAAVDAELYTEVEAAFLRRGPAQ